MKLTFIGAGSAFANHNENYNSNLLLESPKNSEKLLVDCGCDARHALLDLGYTYKDISAVYISHLHFDHVGGLEWLGLTTKFDPSCQRPRLFIHEKVADIIWDTTLRGSMACLEEEEATLETYFDLKSSNSSFLWNDVKFNMVKMIHVYNKDKPQPCYGLEFSFGSKNIFFTGDTRFDLDRLLPYYNKADIIFQDTETLPFKSSVHCHYSEIVALPKSIKKKMWLYHYNAGQLPDCKKDGFRGYVQRRQVFDLEKKETYL
ncbi:MAG: MBL fold hydrolase [Zetaproteobacteria bacterium]|nr:MBL fold hydrolase [Pseudobdellovibrionaceae bacterium]|tara:strand:- start:1835 stop:2614 length:780 start_codon:yes stop_codon:yes gene_type:complete